MTTLREAAIQALEALVRASSYYDTYPEIAALEAALAEPTTEDSSEVEPVEPVTWSHINGTSDTKWHPPQRPAEPVQEPVCDKDPRGCYSVRCQLGRMCKHATPPQRKPEPVALDWLHKWANQDDGEPETQWHEGYEAARRVVQIHLTAPPQRKPLALDAIFKLLDRHPRGLFTMGVDEIWMIAFKCCEKEHGIT